MQDFGKQIFTIEELKKEKERLLLEKHTYEDKLKDAKNDFEKGLIDDDIDKIFIRISALDKEIKEMEYVEK